MAATSLPINVAEQHPEERVGSDDDKWSMDRDHSWPKCVFMAVSISLCITVDILLYSMPLAFLPSVLEDRGYETMEIATAIGVYYWTGFAGGLMLTSYQCWKLLMEREEEDDEGSEDRVMSVAKVKRELKYLILGLAVGAATLIGQALWPRCWVHTVCRFAQGMAGAVIFFYAFLLSASMFQGKQQVFAMTVASTALNIAEVLGSSFGAFVFDTWGQRCVFWCLGVVSLINQVLVVAVMFSIRGTDEMVPESSATPWPDNTPLSTRFSWKGWRKLKRALTRPRTVAAVVLICVAGMVKASMEEVLPFHADHRWHLKPLEIGNLFSVVAIAYIVSAILAGQVWLYLDGHHITFSAVWLVILGFAAWSVLLTASVYKHEAVLVVNLLLYGIGLGFTQTPAALLLAEVVDRERGRAKDAINGVWNTMWEAGGSMGFLLGGLLAEDYKNQLLLFAGYTVVCACAAGLMVSVPAISKLAWSTPAGFKTIADDENVPLQDKSTPLANKPWEPSYGGTESGTTMWAEKTVA